MTKQEVITSKTYTSEVSRLYNRLDPDFKTVFTLGYFKEKFFDEQIKDEEIAVTDEDIKKSIRVQGIFVGMIIALKYAAIINEKLASNGM